MPYTPENLSNINLQAIVEESNSQRMGDSLRSSVSLLKTFDGNPNHLEAFIHIIDTFFNRYYTGDDSQREFVNLAIQSKLIGEANDFLLSRPDLITWLDIREALRLKFGDPISRQNLTQQLIFSTKPRNEPILDYVHKLKTLVHRITSKIRTETLDNNVKTTLIAQTEITATHNLMSNVPQELKTILIIQNPTDLTTAMNTITNYEMLNNQLSFRSQVTQNNIPKPMNRAIAPLTLNRGQDTHLNTNFQPNYSFPRQPIQIHSNPNLRQTNFPTNRQVFGKPQNAFKPTNNSNFPKPTPMSGVSVQSRKPMTFQNQSGNSPFARHTNQQFARPGNSQTFNQPSRTTNHWHNNPHSNPLVFQEITHLEDPQETHETYFEYDNTPELDELPIEFAQNTTNPEIDEENFQMPASEEQYLA